ncbi:trimethylguanosine synthase [Anopheles stephensi]|uniref:trimethylguanosine synthase n=1 Tax=Anopheles stephensi TaxID=30069 RepID=UPI001658ABEF|nr:trimethylguanosine synthase [Anopheles stephensi]
MSASEGHWEPLAEIYLSHPLVKDKKKSIYCLCSRVFIKNYYDVYVSTLERGDSVPLIPSMDTIGQTEPSSCSPVAVKTAESKAAAADGVAQKVQYLAGGHTPDELLDVLDRAEVDDVFIEEPLVKQLSFGRDGVRKMPSKWGDRDAGTTSDASCYFSASASHSDTNYCSTDEHEHVLYASGAGSQNVATGLKTTGNSTTTVRSFVTSGLHSSDSGADLSERIHERKLSLKDELLESGRTNSDDNERNAGCGGGGGGGGHVPSAALMERNNSLPEAFGREDLHDAWETYWSKHGEAIIWASWIEKYSDYINPEYLEPEDHDQATGTNTPHDKSEATPGTATEVDKDFSFDNDAITTTSMQIVVSACSPHPYTKSTYQSAHWPLPFGDGAAGGSGGGGGTGDDALWCAHRSGSCENEALLSPRCDSVTSSIPLTVGTTDSMTNVTRMTISSYDFCSSKVSSDSSNLSESLSSEMSNESSNSSDMLETEYLVGGGNRTTGAPIPPDEEAAMDGEQYWQILWQQHFQELYAKQYHHFMAEHAHDDQSTGCGERSTNSKYHKRKRNSNSGANRGEPAPRSYHQQFQQSEHQLPEMVAEMRLSQAEDATDEPKDGQDEHPSSSSKDTQAAKPAESVEDLTTVLQSYGLPTAFGKPAGDGGDDRPPNEKPVNLKRSHESDNEETPKERLKAAFELMGYCFSDPANETESIINISGEVVYRKKHIRLHNRVLKMKHHKPKHTYFDDDGNELPAAGGIDKVDSAAPEALLLHTSSDDDDETNPGTVGRASVRSSTILEYNQLPVTIERDVDSLESGDGPGETGVIDPPALASSESGCTLPALASTKKEKKKKRKTKFVASLPADIANDRSLLKYWYKRFSLFSLFDSGIRLDRESWFSVTPEKVAAHTAERCRSDLIVDAFCGCGGNTIQFAFSCQKVIAIDIDPRKIEMAKHNATVYGVADRIEFIVGDFMQLVDRLRADVVYLSPPWGGPGYLKEEVYDLEQSLLPVPATQLMQAAQRVSKNIALYLPRNSNTQQLTMLAGPNGAVEIEQNFLDRKLIALTAYYGELINE